MDRQLQCLDFLRMKILEKLLLHRILLLEIRNKGRIQVGSDFSVRTRDFAGNTVEKFFPTGTIIEVTPHVYKENRY